MSVRLQLLLLFLLVQLLIVLLTSPEPPAAAPSLEAGDPPAVARGGPPSPAIDPSARAALVTSAVSRPPSRGYQGRGCGFDLDDDGVRGEPLSDCRLCDGRLDGMGRVVSGTPDPDGDGVAEDLIYVACGSGVDTGGCGLPGSLPCATIQYAWSAIADGPGDGAEDVVCFTGVCAESALVPLVDGVPGFVTRPATGSQSRAFRYPRDPSMLVGWDRDGDGSYPPFDADDESVIDGDHASGAYALFELNAQATWGRFENLDRFEMAHFEVRDWGNVANASVAGPGAEHAFLDVTGGAHEESSYVFIHDLEVYRTNRDKAGTSGNLALDFFGGNNYSWWAFENLLFTDVGGYWARGGGPPIEGSPPFFDKGPLRFQGLTVTAHGCDCGSCGGIVDGDGFFTAFKLWYYLRGIEILDSVIDAQVDAWTPCPSSGFAGAHAGGPAQCVQDVVIRNNHTIDLMRHWGVQGYAAGFCDSPQERRLVTDVVIDANLMENDYAPWEFGDYPLSIDTSGAPFPQGGVGDVTMSNNIALSSVGYEACLFYHGGNNGGLQPGTITFVHNTCAMRPNRFGFLYLDGRHANPHRSWVVKNNLMTGAQAGDRNTWMEFAPQGWDADANVYDPVAGFSWNNGNQPSLAAWRSASGGDAASFVCDPGLAADGHLLIADSCARDRGISVASAVPTAAFDFDGESRPGGDQVDIGADESGPGIFADGFESGDTSAWGPG